jgi:hypothetical protein
MRYDRQDERQVDGQCCGTAALLGALSSELDQPFSIERGQLHIGPTAREKRSVINT